MFSISRSIRLAAFIALLSACAAALAFPGRTLRDPGFVAQLKAAPGGGGGGSLPTPLAAQWKCQDGTGTSLADSSGNGNTGTWDGSTLSWDGTASLQFGGGGWVDVGASTSLCPTIGAFSYTAWVNADISNDRTIIGGASAGHQQFRIDSSTGILRLLSESIASVATSTGAVSANMLTFVAVTCDGAGNYAFYINGAASGTTLNPTTFVQSHTIIGANVAAGSEYMFGNLQFIDVYGFALTQAQVTALYNGGTPIQ